MQYTKSIYNMLRWQSRRTLSSLALTSTSKIQLHVEQLFLNMSWRLAEWLFCNQGCKERSMQSLAGREDKWSGWVPHPSLRTQKRRRISWALGSSLGSEGYEPHIRHPSHGVWQGRWAPLACLKTSEAYWRSIRNQDCSWRAHAQACLLLVTVWWQQIAKCLGLWLACQDNPSMPQPAPGSYSSLSCHCQWESAHLEGIKLAWTLALSLTRVEAAIASKCVLAPFVGSKIGCRVETAIPSGLKPAQ